MGQCFRKSPSSNNNRVPISYQHDFSPPHHYQQVPKRTQQQQQPPQVPRQPDHHHHHHHPYQASKSDPTPSSSSSSYYYSSEAASSILGKPYVDIKTLYILEKELGKGQFGVTYLCTEKATGRLYACKSIARRKLTRKKETDDVRREIMILQHLSGQPNIVEFKGAYEDKQHVHLVMELCRGGELFDRIIAKGVYSEREAASICRQIVNVVHVCHFMGVMHRDLKPENFLMVSKDKNSPLKATDFGLSVFIEEG